jgi:hypothetical protein
MAKLTEEESNLLKRLTAKAKAPDAPAANRLLNISIDLGDEAQVTRAQKLGLLDMFGNDDPPADDPPADDPPADDPPKRKGFFGAE